MTSLKRTLCSGKSKALTTNIHRVCSEGFLGLSSKNVCEGSNILDEAKRCCFVRFVNWQEIKCYIPIPFFSRVENARESPYLEVV